MQWTHTAILAYRNFPLAPPEFPNAPYRARLPEPPYEGAPGWQCSVYYYWWEYLRRHDGYLETCQKKGKGTYAELYRSFGNVHEGDFDAWWWKHLWLFTFISEPQYVSLKRAFRTDGDGIYLRVGFSRSRTEMAAAAKSALHSFSKAEIDREVRKMYRFYPEGRPRLRSLHEHLLVWDARKNNPDASDADLADLAGLTGLERHDETLITSMHARGEYVGDLQRANRRAKQLAVQRHLRIAEQYIANVALGKFPLRNSR